MDSIISVGILLLFYFLDLLTKFVLKYFSKVFKILHVLAIK